jgi:hypothetical protein
MRCAKAGYVWVCCATAVTASFGQTSHAPLSLSISAPASTVKAGSDVRVDITATNISDHDLDFGTEVGKAQAEKDFDIDVRDSAGKEPTETEYGLLLHGKSKGPFGRGGSFKTMRLKPGQNYQDYSILNRVYDLTPGTYTIQASRRDSENKAGVKSNTPHRNDHRRDRGTHGFCPYNQPSP